MSRLDEQSEAGVDTDVRVLTAYVKQCTAEAQEGGWLTDGTAASVHTHVQILSSKVSMNIYNILWTDQVRIFKVYL